MHEPVRPTDGGDPSLPREGTPVPAIEVPRTATLTLSLAALGIVFGDLGTSPLYALQEAFHGQRGVAPTPENVVGCLSLFLWSLILMVSLKYVSLLMRADNHGDHGHGFMRVNARYGFMESPNVPELLQQTSSICGERLFDPMRTSFYLGRESLTLVSTWRVLHGALIRLFILQHRNELDATAHFGIPANRVVEMGARLEVSPD